MMTAMALHALTIVLVSLASASIIAAIILFIVSRDFARQARTFGDSGIEQVKHVMRKKSKHYLVGSIVFIVLSVIPSCVIILKPLIFI